LVVGQAQALFSQLFTQDTVFLDEVIDYLLLTALDPSGHNGDDKLKKYAIHRAKYTGKSGRNLGLPMPAKWQESRVIFTDLVLAPDGVTRVTLGWDCFGLWIVLADGWVSTRADL
jgi:hypothetical protein